MSSFRFCTPDELTDEGLSDTLVTICAYEKVIKNAQKHRASNIRLAGEVKQRDPTRSHFTISFSTPRKGVTRLELLHFDAPEICRRLQHHPKQGSNDKFRL